MAAKDQVGRYGEDVAARHLSDAGWEVLARNWRCAIGELDIVHLHTEFPAAAARTLRIGDVPLLCAQELHIDGALPRVVRVMAHFETDLPRAEVQHVYLRGAEVLRQDLAQ